MPLHCPCPLPTLCPPRCRAPGHCPLPTLAPSHCLHTDGYVSYLLHSSSPSSPLSRSFQVDVDSSGQGPVNGVNVPGHTAPLSSCVCVSPCFNFVIYWTYFDGGKPQKEGSSQHLWLLLDSSVSGFKRHISASPCLSVRLSSANNCITAVRNGVGLDI